MRGAISRPIVLGTPAALALAGLSSAALAQEGGSDDSAITTIASSLTNPRGFDWGPDGTLYLAQAGWGGDNQVRLVEGFSADNGLTSSIATVVDGCATPVAVGLPSLLWVEAGWVWGAMDVAFHDGVPYALISGAGPSWFSPSSTSGVFRLNEDGTMTLIGDVSSWLPQNPPAEIPFDYGQDGSLFSITTDVTLGPDGVLYAVEMATGFSGESAEMPADSGQIVRQTGPDSVEAVVTDLPYPVNLGFDTDGMLLISGPAFGPDAGAGLGYIVKVDPAQAPISFAGYEPEAMSC